MSIEEMDCIASEKLFDLTDTSEVFRLPEGVEGAISDYQLLKQKIDSGELGEINIIKVTNRGFDRKENNNMSDYSTDNISYYLLEKNTKYIKLIKYLTGLDISNKNIITNKHNQSAVINIKLSNNALAVIDTCVNNSIGPEQSIEIFGRMATVILQQPAKSNLKVTKCFEAGLDNS